MNIGAIIAMSGINDGHGVIPGIGIGMVGSGAIIKTATWVCKICKRKYQTVREKLHSMTCTNPNCVRPGCW